MLASAPHQLRSVDDSVLRQSVRGAIEVLETPHGMSPRRLGSAALLQRADDNIRVYSGVATGVRLALETAAEWLELTLRAVRPVALPDTIATPPVLAVEADGLVTHIAIAPFSREWVTADRVAVREPESTARVSVNLAPAARSRPVTVWLPLDAEVTVSGMRADAVVKAAAPSRLPHWLHHGSSISHALEMPMPSGPWPQRAARELGLELTNLSIAGQAVLDPSVARTIAAHPVELITLKLGINLINTDGFSHRTLAPAVHGFLDTIRERQPTTPVVVITAIACPIHENTPGPTIAGPDGLAIPMPRERHPRDARLTLADTREIITRVVNCRRDSDKNLTVLDGTTLLSVDEAYTLRDNLHPDAEGNALIGERFVALARDPRSPLGVALTSASVLQRVT
jgi:hypothetical protein